VSRTKTNGPVRTTALLGHQQIQVTRLYVTPTRDDLARQAESLTFYLSHNTGSSNALFSALPTVKKTALAPLNTHVQAD
jgi:hypothetical protein